MTSFAVILAQAGRWQRFVQDYWLILLPVALAFVAVYWLLPQARGARPLWGALVGAAALIAGSIILVHSQAIWVETLLFYIFAGLAVVGGVFLITQRNPVHAALSFAMVVLATCGLFLLQAAPFLMAATIIVYAGAIVVTFLFVIMLAQQAGLSNADAHSREPFLASVAGFVLLSALVCVLHKSYDATRWNAFLDKVARASQGQSMSEISAALGDPKTFIDDFGQFVEGDRILPTDPPTHAGMDRNALADALQDLEMLVWAKTPEPQAVAKKLEQIHELGRRVRYYQGSLQPSAKLKLSQQSGTPPNADFPAGAAERWLPAQNVAGLGKSLLGDHLLAVELAAVLLLVAPIGAIAIAGRRAEDMR